MADITPYVLELIKSASTSLSPDVEIALTRATKEEDEGSAAHSALLTILKNVRMARDAGRPICQDSGTPIFYVWYPEGRSLRRMREQIQDAVCTATEKNYLCPNAVEALSGINSGNNLGEDFPTIHFDEWEQDHLRIGLMLKGGGSENYGAQYSIPSPDFATARDLSGVRRAVLDAACKAQGLGCAPGVFGVGIGGDRATSMIKAKEQHFRPLGDHNKNHELDKMEKRLHREINELGIGPMGFGGKTTALGVKMAELHRVPASFFVSIAYMCWADRRKIMTLRNGSPTIESP